MKRMKNRTFSISAKVNPSWTLCHNPSTINLKVSKDTGDAGSTSIFKRVTLSPFNVWEKIFWLQI